MSRQVPPALGAVSDGQSVPRQRNCARGWRGGCRRNARERVSRGDRRWPREPAEGPSASGRAGRQALEDAPTPGASKGTRLTAASPSATKRQTGCARRTGSGVEPETARAPSCTGRRLLASPGSSAACCGRLAGGHGDELVRTWTDMTADGDLSPEDWPLAGVLGILETASPTATSPPRGSSRLCAASTRACAASAFLNGLAAPPPPDLRRTLTRHSRASPFRGDHIMQTTHTSPSPRPGVPSTNGQGPETPETKLLQHRQRPDFQPEHASHTVESGPVSRANFAHHSTPRDILGKISTQTEPARRNRRLGGLGWELDSHRTNTIRKSFLSDGCQFRHACRPHAPPIQPEKRGQNAGTIQTTRP